MMRSGALPWPAMAMWGQTPPAARSLWTGEAPVPTAAGSGACAEGFLFWLLNLFFFFGDGARGYVLHKFAAAFLLAFAFDLADAASWHGAGLKADDAAFAHYDLRAEPVGAVHASGGVERHRSGDRAFEFVSRAGEEALAHLLRPGEASD